MSWKLCIAVILMIPTMAYSKCPQSKTIGPIEITALSCHKLNPNNHWLLNKKLNESGIPNREKSKILEKYEGYEIKTGEKRYFLSGSTGFDCSDVSLSEETVIIASKACCDGSWSVPCFLGYSDRINRIIKMKNY